MRTIFRRSFTGFLVVILILAVLSPLLIYNTVRPKLASLVVSDLERTAEALEFTFSGMLTMDPTRMDSIADMLGEKLEIRITLIDRDGLVLADSEEQADSMENHRTRPEIICAFNGETGTSVRHSATLDKDMIYVAVPVFVDGGIPAVIRTSMFLSQQEALFHDVMLDIAIVMGVVLLAGLSFAWISSRSFARPIRSMADAARKVGGGDYSIRLAPCSIRELSSLASDINAMIARTDQLIGELSSSNASLDAVFRSIVEGLLVIDSEGHVLAANRSFRAMSGSGGSEPGGLYLDFVANGEFRDFIGKVVGGEMLSGEFDTGGRTYSAKAGEIPEIDQYVITFRDVTEISETVRMKREFAANASHELRTPLTSIKGYAETVMESLDDEQKKYLGIILRNADRLIRIVDDMRILSELEHPRTRLDITPVDMAEVVENTVELFRSRAGEKGLSLMIEMEDDLPLLQADRFRLEQVLINLVENAIKYTSEGSVTLRLGSRGGYLILVVSDTGVGIEEDHLGRLFERFYVVDKARSRSRGGTGLGLAIVKHIVSLHDGWVRVSSTPGSGTMFTVGLPLQSRMADHEPSSGD